MTETIAQLLALHRSGERPVAETVARTYARLRAADDPAIFIALREEADEDRRVVGGSQTGVGARHRLGHRSLA